VLVAVNGRTIYRSAFGEANREWHAKNTPEVRFRIGSITKAFTANLVLQLVERGALRLDAHVSDYLPTFAPALGRQITVRQLLTHTSGLPDFNSFPDFFNQVQGGLLNDEQILTRIGGYELLSPPGTKFAYSNDGYVILGAIIAAVTSTSYEDALDENILKRAGLKATTLNHPDRVTPMRAAGYRRILGGFENVVPYVADAAGGLLSTVDDLLRWDEALYGNTLLSDTSKNLMWSISPNGNAYGWLVSRQPVPRSERDSMVVIKGDGAVPGFYALTLRVPRNHVFIAALTNNRGPKNYLPDMGKGILDILYGLPATAPRRSLADWLRREIPTLGAAKTISAYRAAQAKGESFEVDENHINSVGYLALQSGRISDALTVFELNASLFPESANVHDSLGDALARAGRRSEAIVRYKRALELNPRSSETAKKLQRLTADSSSRL
jgi:CubicO group peptidase (beta-lactamase class C family)